MPFVTGLSNLVDPIDPNVMSYNGSVLYVGGNYLLAYRATIKPVQILENDRGDDALPSLPWQWIYPSAWVSRDNHIGLAVLNLVRGQFKVVSHTRLFHLYDNDTPRSWYAKRREGGINLIIGPEDPRLYIRDRNVYMSYVSKVISDDGKRDCVPQGGIMCSATFEIAITPDMFQEHDVFIGEDDRSMICEDLYYNIPARHGMRIAKNWSHFSPPGRDIHVMIDSYNRNTAYYQFTDNISDCQETIVRRCWQDGQLKCLKAICPEEWSVALTTPTINMHKQLGLGVAHIRVTWRDLIKYRDDLQPEFRSFLRQIRRNKIPLLGDVYLMMFYLIDVNHNFVRMGYPFIFAPEEEGYIPYSVNFPCGVCAVPDGIMLTFGVGDCLLYTMNIKASEIANFTSFKPDHLYTYSDLRVIYLGGTYNHYHRLEAVREGMHNFDNTINSLLDSVPTYLTPDGYKEKEDEEEDEEEEEEE